MTFFERIATQLNCLRFLIDFTMGYFLCCFFWVLRKFNLVTFTVHSVSINYFLVDPYNQKCHWGRKMKILLFTFDIYQNENKDKFDSD